MAKFKMSSCENCRGGLVDDYDGGVEICKCVKVKLRNYKRLKRRHHKIMLKIKIILSHVLIGTDTVGMVFEKGGAQFLDNCKRLYKILKRSGYGW